MDISKLAECLIGWYLEDKKSGRGRPWPDYVNRLSLGEVDDLADAIDSEATDRQGSERQTLYVLANTLRARILAGSSRRGAQAERA